MGMSPPENVSVTLIFELMTLKNTFMARCMKYLCKFWVKSCQWFRSCRVHKISMAVTGWPWPLTQCQCHQCHMDLWSVSLKYIQLFRRYNDE